MQSMTLATLGWGVWWVGLLLARFAPWLAPDFLSGRTLVTTLSSILAALGLVLALLTVRAKRSWLPFAAVAIFANLSLLLLPLLLQGLETPGEAG
jgi:hypothetical protein